MGSVQEVRANQGTAGVDDQSIADFEADLTNNLYKLWNRLSSGSYHPPPVRRVEIPKGEGGTRPLGIPTVADRIAQTVVKLIFYSWRRFAVRKLLILLVWGADFSKVSCHAKREYG